MLNFARNLFIRSIAPLGASRAKGFFRQGMPQEFRPALEYLFTNKLTAKDQRVVARVEGMRNAFARSGKTLHIYDVTQTEQVRTAHRLATLTSVTPQWGTFLYLCSRGFHADTILELGTCIGISGSYLASAPTCRQFISIERSADVSAVAKTHIPQIFSTAELIIAAADDALPHVLQRFSQGIALYYIDSNHSYAPTLRYFQQAFPFLKPGALVIFDDIHWSKEMWDAWLVLRSCKGFSHTLDVGRFGLCVWQGGTITPKHYNLAKYAGWLRQYDSSR